MVLIIGFSAIVMGILELFYVRKVDPEYPLAKKSFIALGIVTIILGVLIILTYFHKNL